MTGTSTLGSTAIGSATIAQLKGPVELSGNLAVSTLTVRQDCNVLGTASALGLAITGGATVAGMVTVGAKDARTFGGGRGVHAAAALLRALLPQGPLTPACRPPSCTAAGLMVYGGGTFQRNLWVQGNATVFCNIGATGKSSATGGFVGSTLILADSLNVAGACTCSNVPPTVRSAPVGAAAKRP